MRSTPNRLPLCPATMMAAAASVGHSAMKPGKDRSTVRSRPQEIMAASPAQPSTTRSAFPGFR
jgi:hypothetical protein